MLRPWRAARRENKHYIIRAIEKEFSIVIRTRRRNAMKNIIGSGLAVLLVVGLASIGQASAPAATAVPPVGPPEPMADPGKFSLGFGYWFAQSEMKFYNGTLDDTPALTHFLARSNQYYGQGTFTLLKDWEVYGGLGEADLRVEGLKEVRDSGEPDGTLGFKGVIYRYESFAFGPFIEGACYGHHGTMFYDQWSVSLGASSQYKIPVGGRDLTVYGGPFMYWHENKAELVTNSGMTGGVPISGQLKQEQWSNFGGFLGVKFPIVTKKVFFTVEGQMTSNASLGASISYLF
jgi:hypothetical protein